MSRESRTSPLTTRRRFLGEASCSALSSVTTLNMLFNLKLANQVAAATAPTDRKTLVCVMLGGGIDTFNVLVPHDSARYATYKTTRGNLALPNVGVGSILPLNQASGGDDLSYGIHPSCGGLQTLFNGIGGDTSKRRLSFVANVGTLVQPTTKAQYENESVPLPRALFSHSDQTDQWQTSVPQGLQQATGWAGRAADMLHDTANTGPTAMNISFAGNNLWQVGGQTQQFVVTDSGALTLTEPYGNQPSTNPLNVKNLGHEGLLAQTYANLIQKSYAQISKESIDLQKYFLQIFNDFDSSTIDSLFPANYYGSNFLAAAKTIALREALGLRRQTLLLNFGGWDMHGELLQSQVDIFSELIPAMKGFQDALELLGLADSVITFTSSEFGRTLRSNGRGTDHAWGSNHIAMGGAVAGGRIKGTFPDLTLDSNDDVGYGGRLLPTTSVDAFFCELLRWFGVSSGDMPYVLPNIGNFYSPTSSTLPLGFLKDGTWS